MLGKLLGKVLTLPIRVINVPIKLTQKAAEAAHEFMLGSSPMNYRAPRRNSLDKLSDNIEETTEDAMGD